MTGKIAHLPTAIREELNCRLHDGESGKALVQWLNSLPEVQAVLKSQFGGRPISEPNLSKWKAWGYRRCLARRDTLAELRHLTQNAADLDHIARGRLTDNLATVLAARYAAAIADWNGQITPEFRQRIRVLRSLCHGVADLRRGDHRRARLELDHERLEAASELEHLEYLKSLDAQVALERRSSDRPVQSPAKLPHDANDNDSSELP